MPVYADEAVEAHRTILLEERNGLFTRTAAAPERIADLATGANPAIPLPQDIFPGRRNSAGVDLADPLVRGLANKVNQSVVLVAYIGGERVVVDVMQAGTSLNPYYSTWLHGPMHASGPGKALLLASDPARREALLGKPPYAARTSKTLTTKAALDADLKRAAENGYVLVRDEFYDGLSAIAANYYSWDKTALGCLAITACRSAMMACCSCTAFTRGTTKLA